MLVKAIMILNKLVIRNWVYEHNASIGKHCVKIWTNSICVSKERLHIPYLDRILIDVENLSQKINVKLGGINSVVSTKSALTRSSKEDLFMFFGADVSLSSRIRIKKHRCLGHTFDFID
jgi:hypothetical protein